MIDTEILFDTMATMPKCRIKHRCIACPLLMIFIFTGIILHQLMMSHDLIFPTFSSQTPPLLSASCLNSVFDEIFVFSIRSRIQTLSITLQQLEQESIIYTLWEGHSDFNTHSNEIYQAFVTQQCPIYNSTMDKHVFFLRQTQIDILKYAKQQNSKKILIFEDDIILANPSLIQMFCEVEPFLPKWDVLGIGVNQHRHIEELASERIILYNISEHETKFMKYWDRTRYSYGAFGIGFAANSFDLLLSAFDYETSGVCTDLPLDNLNRYKPENAFSALKSINIFPTLVLPDVTDSTHKIAGKHNESYQREWIREHTLIENAKFFSKYYPLRFAKDNDTRKKRTLSHDHVMHLLKYGIKTKNQLSLMGKERMEAESHRISIEMMTF